MRRYMLWGWLLIFFAAPSMVAQELNWLGVPPGYSSSQAVALTPDGEKVLVRSSDTTLTQVLTTVWNSSTQSSTPVDTTWVSLQGYDIAADGETIVGIGMRQEGDPLQPFLRRADTTVVLSTPEGTFYALARGISQDRRVIVGSWVDSTGLQHPCWWDSTGIFAELPLPAEGIAEALDVSADGSRITGVLLSEQEYTALLWRWAGSGYVVERLPALPNYPYIAARAIAPNGTFIVGVAADTSWNPVAVYWDLRSAPVQVQRLPLPDSIVASEAGVVSDSTVSLGSAEPTILGRWQTSSGEGIFRWTPQTGYEDLSETYSAVLQDGSELGIPTAISADGRYIVGVGYNATSQRVEAFRLGAGNFPPSIPELLAPDSAARVGPTPTFVVRGEDPNSDSVRYEIEVWKGTEHRTYQTAWVASGQVDSVRVPIGDSLSVGQWQWRARTWDVHNVSGPWSTPRPLEVEAPSHVGEEPGNAPEVTISPQPVSDHGWVQVRLGRLEQARVEVRDVLGRLVTVLGEGVLGEQRWQLPQLAPGVYTVVVRTGQNVAARQFVVTR